MYRDQISNMDMMNKSNKDRKKVTIGIFGRSGEGKVNLSDSDYTAEIEFISKEVSLSIFMR